MNKECVNMITEISDCFGPSGFEDDVVKTASKYASFAELSSDRMRNLYITPKGMSGEKPLVVLDAHSDEVGLMVHSIKPDGTLRFVPLGSISPSCLPATAVSVKNERGELVNGMIGSVPPHYANKLDAKDFSALSIDVGAINPQECSQNYAIAEADPVIFSTVCEFNEENGIFMGKAFDCRIGCAAVIESLKELEGETLSVDVMGVLSSQEEIGARGAKVAAKRLDPDVVICFEGCPADDTIAEPYAMQTKLKHGPMLRHIDVSMVTNPRFQKFALNIAEKYNVPVQRGVREGGGTNGEAYHTCENAAACIVIGVPVRYIHTPHCIAALSDFEAAVELAVNIVKELNEDIIESF